MPDPITFFGNLFRITAPSRNILQHLILTIFCTKALKEQECVLLHCKTNKLVNFSTMFWLVKKYYLRISVNAMM